jgi:hypothetical protein
MVTAKLELNEKQILWDSVENKGKMRKGNEMESKATWPK